MNGVSRSVRLPNASLEEVWEVAGSFQQLHGWHPGVESTEIDKSDDKVVRRLNLKDGGVIVEELRVTGNGFYDYAIIDGPLPVKDYHSQLSVGRDASGCVVVIWCCVFDSLSEHAEEVVAGIYQAGLDASKERFGS